MSLSRFSMVAAFGLAALASAPSAEAAFISGGDTFYAAGKVSDNTGSLATATTFTIKGFSESAGNASLDFNTYEGNGLSFGTETLTLTHLTATTGTASFGFSDGGYGTFTAATYIVDSIGTNSVAYYLLGTFSPGTDFPAADQGVSQPASFVVSFNQAPGSNPSFSGSLSVPPGPPPGTVPEPASIAMLGLGLVGVGGFAARRRAAK